jgi:hypothetical protein
MYSSAAAAHLAWEPNLYAQELQDNLFIDDRSLEEEIHYCDAKSCPVECLAYCRLLRDIFGNPFRPGLLQPAWLSPAVRETAQIAYDDREFPTGALNQKRMVALADALEQAGCFDGVILSHCRGPGEHVRGCWVLDLLLGKERSE